MSNIPAGVCVQQEKVEGLITNSFGRLKPFIDQGEEVKSTASALSTAWIEFQICRVHIHMFFVVVLLLFDVVDDCDVVVFCVGEGGLKRGGEVCGMAHHRTAPFDCGISGSLWWPFICPSLLMHANWQPLSRKKKDLFFTPLRCFLLHRHSRW